MGSIFSIRKNGVHRMCFPVNFSEEFRTAKRSQWKYSAKKGVLKSFAIFTEKHLCWSLFLTKLQWLLLN